MAVVQPASSNGERLSIGQVLERLNSDFADLTLSKLRFLEEQGLITPERTESGYRKFTQQHIERLRLILTLQRDQYLPLKVIAEFLQELDAGNDPEVPGSHALHASSILSPRPILSRAELLRKTGASSRLLGEAIASGLIPARDVYPDDTVAQLQALIELSKRGVTPRHLRALRVAAERDAELIEQVVHHRGRNDSHPETRDEVLELASLLATVREGIVRQKILG